MASHRQLDYNNLIDNSKEKPRDRQRSNVKMVCGDKERDSDDHCLMVESVNSVYQKESSKKIFTTMVLDETLGKFQLDSGETVNILPAEIYKEVKKDPKLKHLKNTKTTLVMFNNSELKPLETAQLQTCNPKNDETYLIEYTVVSTGLKALLGVQSIQQFSLMSVNIDNIYVCVSGDTSSSPTLLADYKDVFVGQGQLEEKFRLTVDKSAALVILPVRKVPIAMKEPLKNEIDRLVGHQFLKPVDTPTDWVSSMVAVMKSNASTRSL